MLVVAFDPDTYDDDPAFELLRYGAVTLFWRASLLAETVQRLTSAGYQVVEVEASIRDAEHELPKAIGDALDFPDIFTGRSLDAFNDWLGDVAYQHYGWRPDATGLVLVLVGYDYYARKYPRTAQIILDLFAHHSRIALLFGRRMLCLVQTDDPDASFAPVGAQGVYWNGREQRISSRHPAC